MAKGLGAHWGHLEIADWNCMFAVTAVESFSIDGALGVGQTERRSCERISCACVNRKADCRLVLAGKISECKMQVFAFLGRRGENKGTFKKQATWGTDKMTRKAIIALIFNETEKRD